MSPVTDYTVTYGRGSDVEAAIKALRAAVKKGIGQGWDPVGGVAVQYVRDGDGAGEVVMVQAMVKP